MRLIDACRIRYMWAVDPDGNYHDGVTLQSIIDKMPTVDAVEVVRCKDCKHGELDEDERDDYYLCHYHGCDWNDGDHFCSYGERRNNG